MKRAHSIILLFAFLVGVMQPLVPLMEYHLFKDHIAEHLCENRHDPDSDCDGRCYLAKQVQKSQESSERNTLGSTFYPGAVIYGKAAELIRPMDHPALLSQEISPLIEIHPLPSYPPPEFV